MQAELTTKNIAQVGEEITHDLGAKMIQDYQAANPTDIKGYVIGSNILQEIMSQPGCVGISFYNAYNEMGDKTLVYVGIDRAGKVLSEYSVVNYDGTLGLKKAIVADRTIPTDNDTFVDWEWLSA